MAQLKDTIIQGDARVTDTLYANTVNTSTLSATNLAANKLTLNTNSNDVVLNLDQLDYVASDGTSYAKISASTYGTLGIFSKRLIAIYPAGSSDASGSTAASNTYQNTDGVYIDINRMWPIKNNSMSLGISNYKWSDLYATLISPDKIRINTTSSRTENLYVNGTLRFYLGSSSISVTDRKFTIAGGSNSEYEISFGAEAIQAYNNSQAVKNLFLQPRGGNLIFGQGSSISTTAYSFYPNQNDKHTLGSSSYKWANVYATTATLNGLSVVGGDIVMSEASGHGATHKLIFQRGTATDAYTNWKLYNNSVGVLILQAYHNGLDADTDILQVLCPTTSQTPALVPGTTNSYDIGSSSLVWRNIYATNLYGTLATSDLTGQVAVANGGTGASDAANARTNLGLGTIAVKDTDDYYNIGGGGTVVSSTQDFDTLTDFGNYYRTANSDTTNMTHIPQKQAFTLKIMSASGSNSRIRQVFQPYNKSIIYMRSKSSATDATWTAWQYQPVVTPTENDGTYVLTKGSNSLPVYVDSNGEIQSISSLILTAAGSTIQSQVNAVSYKTSAAADTTCGLNIVNGTTVLGHIGHNGNQLILYNCTENATMSSPAIIFRNALTDTSNGMRMNSTDLAPVTTTLSSALALGSSTNKWKNVYAGLITPNAATYTTTTTAGIVFYNSSALCGHIGAATGGAVPGSIGLQTTGQIVFRAGATLDSGVLDGDYGMNLSSTELAPKTNAAALDTAGALTLGSNTAQWTTTYSKQYVVDAHVTLAYDSTDKSLNFNFT